MSRSLRIGLTGATGQIGAHILEALVEAGHEDIHCLSRHMQEPVARTAGVTWYQGDITDLFTLDAFMDSVDIVIHAAGLVSYRNRDHRALGRTNVQGTGNLINLSLDSGGRHFIHISSSAVLGQPIGGKPLDESASFLPGDAHRIYANSKYEGELEVWRGMEEGLGISIVQPTIVLDPLGKGRSTRVLIDAVCSGNGRYPGGSHGFVDARDVAQAVMMLVDRGPVRERILLNGENTSYQQILDQMAVAMGRDSRSIVLSEQSALWMNRIRRWLGRGGLSETEVRMAYEHRAYNADRAEESYGISFRPLEKTIRDMARNCPCF